MYLTELLFLWQTQIQTMKYGLNDTKRIKSYIDTLLNMNFQTIFDA